MPSKRALLISVATFVVIWGFFATASPAFAAAREKVLYSFCPSPPCKHGANPYAGLIFDGSGNLYGTTAEGGAQNDGTVFQLTPGANGEWTEKVLHSFTGNDGSAPGGGLTFDGAGDLCGTTHSGGAYGFGTVFQLTRGANGKWKEKLLHSFNGSDGAYPIGSLIVDAAGSIYGTTEGGGAYCSGPFQGCGTVFQLTPDAHGKWAEKVLHSFGNGSDGVLPSGGLVFDPKGNMYGPTSQGGAQGGGAVFEMMPGAKAKWKEKVLYSFGVTDNGGAVPCEGLIFDAAGNLYGTTTLGGDNGVGNAFQLSLKPNGKWVMKILHTFGGSDGAEPFAGLILDKAGNLYGTTTLGGNSQDYGTAFRLRPGADGHWTFAVLHTFTGDDGANPYAGLVLDTAGNLYGATAFGGNPNCGRGASCGVVFEITP